MVDQGRDLSCRGDGPPVVHRAVLDQREVDPERDVRPAPKELQRVRGTGTRRHQAARARDPVVDGGEDRGVDRAVRAQVVRVHDQQPSIGRKFEQFVGEEFRHSPSLILLSTGNRLGWQPAPLPGRRASARAIAAVLWSCSRR